ncbi:hypothetical protein M0Q97_09850 [Candidatus Dojkabacteria bacterium]|jgi:hypothetical protein|nr:hypothetical protein [Candidatus Dojkabacteria bacterium]
MSIKTTHSVTREFAISAIKKKIDDIDEKNDKSDKKVAIMLVLLKVGNIVLFALLITEYWH